MRLLSGLAVVALCAGSANAAFSPYVIRNSGGGTPPSILPNNTYVPGALEYVISEGGMKAGLGSGDVDGATIGDLTNMSITRYDDASRFSAGSGPAVAPYFNIWVTDGVHYAVLANEPSNPSFAPFRTANPGGGYTYSFSMADIAAEPVQVYETPNGGYGSTTTWVHDLVGNHPLTFADVMGLTISAPNAAYITNPVNAVGSGAPDELGTNVAFGFNWIFGDTLSNYVSGMEGYVVSNASVSVPAPGAFGLVGLGAFGAARRRRR